MEPLIKTTFPINSEVENESLFEIVSNWLSHNSDFKKSFGDKNILGSLIKEPDFYAQLGRSTLEKISVDIPEIRYSSFSFTHPGEDSSEKWRTTMTARIIPEEEQGQISVMTEHGDSSWNHQRLSPRKPALINLLLEGLPKAHDGWMPIWTKPHYLVDGDEEFFADYIRGKDSEIFLPMIYLTRSNETGETVIDPEFFAKRLAGIGHTIVEPEGHFSRRLNSLLEGSDLECYDGGIRIYWPRNTDPKANKLWIRKLFQPDSVTFSKRKPDAIRTVTGYLASRTRGLSLTACNHDYVRNLKRRVIIRERLEELREKRETDEKDWNDQKGTYEQTLDLYEKQTSDLEITNAQLESRVERLSEENSVLKDDLELAQMNMRDVQSYNAKKPIEEEICMEDSLLAVERFLETRGDALSPYMKETLEGVLGERGEILERIKTQRERAYTDIATHFNQYSRMTSSLKTVLNRNGFDYTNKGKHYHVVKKGFNPDIFVTLSKTTDKPRAGKNFIGDMKRTFFDY